MTRDPVVRVPADVDVEDRLVGPLTFRAAAWLAVAAAGGGLCALAQQRPLAAIPGVFLVASGLVCAFWKPGGRAVTAWVLPLIAYLRRRPRGRPETAADTPTDTAAITGHVADSAVAAETAHERPRRRGLLRPAAVLLTFCAALAVILSAHPWRVLGRSHTDSPVPGPAATPTPIPTRPAPIQPAAPAPVPTVVVIDPWWLFGEEGSDGDFDNCPCFP